MNPDSCAICGSPCADAAGPCTVCGAPPATPARHLPAGTRLQNGKFSLGRVLGEGGFGITYLGAHRYLRRTVAIKELFPERAVRHGAAVSVSEWQQRDFRLEKEAALAEARALSHLVSPHIVEVQDAFLENNTAYIVMEYLEGQTLQERIDAEGALPPNDVCGIGLAACDALAEVHQHDLLHRDIKPANLMLTRDGRVVLVDFGSARTFDHGQTVRHTRILTADYAAPEMFSTQARFAPATDLFCLGGTLYHALTGSPPPSVMDRLQDPSLDLAFPNALRSPSTEPLIAAVRQALQIRVENRPPSAADFRATLLDSVVPVAVDKAATAPTELPSRGSTRPAPPDAGNPAQTGGLRRDHRHPLLSPGPRMRGIWGPIRWWGPYSTRPEPRTRGMWFAWPNVGRWMDALSRGQWTWVGGAVLLILTVIVFDAAMRPTATPPAASQPTATPPPCRSLEVSSMFATFWDLSCTTEREQSEFWKGQTASLLSHKDGWMTDTFVASWEVYLEDALEPAILQHGTGRLRAIRARDCLTLAVQAAGFIADSVFATSWSSCHAYKRRIDNRFANWLEKGMPPQPIDTPIPLFDIGSAEEPLLQPTNTPPRCRRLADVPLHAIIGLPIDTTLWDLSCSTEEEQAHFWEMTISNVKKRTGWSDWPVMWDIFTETWISAAAKLQPLIPQYELQSIRAYDCIHLAMQAAGFHSEQPAAWRWIAVQPTCNAYKPLIDEWFRNWPEAGPSPSP